MVVGRLRLSRWETPEGDKRSAYGLDVDEVGPSLRFATAKVARMARTKVADVPDFAPDDQWETASTTRPAPAMPAAA